ncbi:MAG: hypothetical protein ACKVS6_08340 [Planctomycetota bacterium]
MNSSNTLSLPVAILVFMGGLGGGVLGSLIFAGASPRPQDSQDSGIVAITAAIQQLSRDVRKLAERSDLPGEAAAPSREAAAPDSRPGAARGNDTNEKLILAIERLTASLASSLSGRGSARAAPLSVNVGIPIPTQQKRIEMFNPILGLEYEKRSQKHHFMTYQQIIDLYGVPDTIDEHGSGVSFDYNINEGTDEHIYMQFRFIDGFCIRVDG